MVLILSRVFNNFSSFSESTWNSSFFFFFFWSIFVGMDTALVFSGAIAQFLYALQTVKYLLFYSK